jgi:uncharacterized protein
MKISDERMPQPDAKNAVGFAHLLSAQDVAPRGPFEIVLADDKLGATALVEGRRCADLPARVLAFSEDVPIGERSHPFDGQPVAYVRRKRTCTGSETTAKAPIENCTA